MAQYLLGQRSILPKELFEFLNEAQVKAVCEACGVVSAGRRGKLIEKLLRIERGPTFVALDFETADYPRDSACALGLVRVELHRIVQRAYHLIRPPRRRFAFTYLHGITWEDVAGQPTFADLWPSLNPILKARFSGGPQRLVDRSVLDRCCETVGFDSPGPPFAARCAWRGKPGISIPPTE